jgi:Ca2+-transporting ATPase
VQNTDGGSNHVLNGSSTENALILAAISAGIDIAEARQDYPLLENFLRNGKRRYMMTIHGLADGRRFIAAKGDPTDVVALCKYARSPDGDIIALHKSDRERILSKNEAMSRNGLRVLGFASADHAPAFSLPPKNLVWLGLIGMADPVRSDIVGVLQEFHDAGIRTVMVTGDQAGTASAIAEQVQLSPTRKIVDGMTFLQGTNEEIVEHVGRYDVFSRVSPAHKLDIVQAMQRSGLRVAMTGDGTNDAPALRAADIGVAMGRHGTTAAREIADVVLAEDDLSTMVIAVRQGRAIYANLRKAIHFLVGTNSSEVFVTLGAAACGMGQPLNPGQLLWLNLVTDVAIAYALGLEPVEYDVMQQPPRPPEENIIRPGDYRRLALKSGLFSVSALATHIYGMARYGRSGGGIAFSTLIGAQLLDGLSSRSETQPAWSMPQNRTLTLAITGTAALQGMVSLLPFTRRLLGLAAFDLLDLGVIAAGSLWPFLLVETVIKPNAVEQPALASS